MNLAQELLKLDKGLEKCRYKLVPKYLNEEDFWRNYFYRIHLISSIQDIQKTNDILNEKNKRQKKKKKMKEYDFTELEIFLLKFEKNSLKLRSNIQELQNLKRNKQEISEEKLFYLKILENFVIEDKKIISSYLIEIKDEIMFERLNIINEKIALILKECEIYLKKTENKENNKIKEYKIKENQNYMENLQVQKEEIKKETEIKIITEKDDSHFGLDDDLEMEMDLDLSNINEVTTEETLPWEEEEKLN
jgi:hypothetical protein